MPQLIAYGFSIAVAILFVLLVCADIVSSAPERKSTFFFAKVSVFALVALSYFFGVLWLAW